MLKVKIKNEVFVNSYNLIFVCVILYFQDYDELYQLDCDHQVVEEDTDYSGVVGLVHAHTVCLPLIFQR